jgi:hypothetical protein
LASFSGSVSVGCASGVDALVRSAFASASVFRVGSFAVIGRVSRASFALRSSALVHSCASSGGLKYGCQANDKEELPSEIMSLKKIQNLLVDLDEIMNWESLKEGLYHVRVLN